MEAYLNYKNQHFGTINKEFESKFKDYRDINEEEEEKNINEKFSQPPIHQLLKQMRLDELLWDFDAVSLCTSAMWDEKSFYPSIETGYAFTKEMNGELVNTVNIQTFNQGSAILKIKYYDLQNLIVQPIPNEQKVKKNWK